MNPFWIPVRIPCARAFRVGYEDPAYVDLVRAALPLWRDLEARSGERLLTLCGMIVFARSGHAALDGIVGTLAKMKVTYEHLDAASMSRRFPLLQLSDDRVGYWTPEAGFLDPGRSVRALIGEARRAGARVIEGARVERLDLEADSPAVVTATERYRCRPRLQVRYPGGPHPGRPGRPRPEPAPGRALSAGPLREPVAHRRRATPLTPFFPTEEFQARVNAALFAWLIGSGLGDHVLSNTAVVTESGAELLTETVRAPIVK